MKHLLKKIRRNKLDKHPRKPISLGNPPDTAVRPSSLRSQPGAHSEDERGDADPWIGLRDRADMALDRELLASEARASGVTIVGTSYGSESIVEVTSDAEGRDVGSTGASRAVERALEGALPQSTTEVAERFGPLKTVLQTIPVVFANREGSIVLGNKIEDLLTRIVTLEERFDSHPNDVEEQRGRYKLIHELGNIGESLRSLSESSRQRPHVQVEVGDDIFKPLEGLRVAIFHYQMSERTRIDNQVLKLTDPGQNVFCSRVSDSDHLKPLPPATAEEAVLNNFLHAKNAEYRHGDRNGCTEGTRITIMDEIERWIRDFRGPPVYWLNGLAGTGKSTIAQTIAERVFADGLLGASFFCSRDFEDRRNLKFIFPTLAVQLARTHTEFRSIFVPLVRSDPGIAYESLYSQLNKLIVQPLVKTAISTVIVIDALDECKDDEPTSAILSVLGQFVTQVPKVKFFITGRPEPCIQKGFRLKPLARATDVFLLHEVEQSQINDDIRLFLRQKFSELGYKCGPDGWPSEEELRLLCERSAGLFVHAVATAKFICQKGSNPKRQLVRLLQSPESSAFEGITRFKGNATLDSLYTSILQGAFVESDPENDTRIRSVLGAVVLATNPLSLSTIAALLCLDIEDVLPLLLSANSLLALQEDTDHPVRPFHKSFPDFIVDPARCTDPRFRVHPPDRHAELLFGCLELMNRELEQNMCELPDGVINSEVGDLGERIGRRIGRALQYACRSWHKHLPDTAPPHVISALREFLEKKFLFWLEVLSVLGAAREAVDALDATAKCEWLDASTLDLARDYFRFATTFFEVINTSAPHIYHSALPLSPQTSAVHKLYKPYIRPFVRVVRGLSVSWDLVASMKYNGGLLSRAVWSPCSRFIAAVEDEAAVIFDAVTLDRLHTFSCPTKTSSGLSFSPDSRVLTQYDSGLVTSWDLQTGGPLGAISGPYRLDGPHSYAYSADGRVFVAAVGFPSSTTIDTYDLLSRTHEGSYCVSEGRVIHPIWTRSECLRFATEGEGRIVVWEAAFTFIHPPAEVASFPVPINFNQKCALFHPTPPRLVFFLEHEILVWDVEASKLLLESDGPTMDQDLRRSYQVSFSSDGHVFACIAGDPPEACVWRESPTGFTLNQRLIFPGSEGRGFHPQAFLSPNGESIVAHVGGAIRLWHTKDQVPDAPSLENYFQSFILTFSPDGSLAAFVRREGSVVTVLNLQSGEPRLVINTGMKVDCLAVAGDTVAVAEREKVVTWKLPVGGHASNARGNISNGIRTTTLKIPPRGTAIIRRYSSMSPDLSRIAVVWLRDPRDMILDICDMATGMLLTSTERTWTTPVRLRFTLDGREVWIESSHGNWEWGWEILHRDESGPTKLKPLRQTACPQDLSPWRSLHGYEVTEGGWVLSPAQKRLLLLPRPWRLELDRIWSGRYLGLGYHELEEVVILEFLE